MNNLRNDLPASLQPDRNSASLRVLVVEDSASDFELIIYSLKKRGYESLMSLQVQTENELKEALKTRPWDVIISDYNIPGFDALDGLQLVREQDQDLPFIVVSGGIGEESVADMMKAGVEDFVMKSRLDRLPAAISRVLREKNLRQTEAMAKAEAQAALLEREKMISIVSHDIKNPLSAIQLSAELLLKGNPSPEVAIHAQRILETSERMKSLIYDLLDRKSPVEGLFVLHKSRNNFAVILDEAAHSLENDCSSKKINVELSLPPDPVFLDIDKSKIYQVLTNLLGNACKFSPPNSRIRMSVTSHQDHLRFEIEDQGVGILPENLDKVFQEKWTTASRKEEGHGLGLFICKNIIEAHEGQIGVKSQGNKGSAFWFTLPGPIFTMLKDEKTGVSLEKPLVMVIDDDDDLREVVVWALKAEGLQVLSFADPQAAYEQLASSTIFPAVIIVDYHMGSMTAGDFLNLKNSIPDKRLRECPVMIMTAAPQNARRIPGADQLEILEKPLDLKGLISKVGALCAKSPT